LLQEKYSCGKKKIDLLLYQKKKLLKKSLFFVAHLVFPSSKKKIVARKKFLRQGKTNVLLLNRENFFFVRNYSCERINDIQLQRLRFKPNLI